MILQLKLLKYIEVSGNKVWYAEMLNSSITDELDALQTGELVLGSYLDGICCGEMRSCKNQISG